MKKIRKGNSLPSTISTVWNAGSELIKDILCLFFLELDLAKQNIIKMLLLLTLLGMLVISTWVCIIFLLILWLMSIQFNLIAAIFITFIINIILTIVILISFIGYKKRIRFDATREELKHLLENDYE